MFFEISKIAWFLIAPSNAIPALVAIGLGLIIARRRKLGLTLAIAAVAAWFVGGLSPLPNMLLSSLENRFPAWEARGRTPHGIIILGGATDPVMLATRGVPAVNDLAERMIEGVRLARLFPQARIVFAGGDGRLIGEAGNEADDARAILEGLGVDPARITYERESRNTWENAVFTKRLLEPKPSELWLLVTSGWHMPRSMGIFRAIDFPVEAYPVDFRTTGPDDRRSFSTTSDGLRRLDTGLREYVGLLAYRLTGRTSVLIPGP